MTTIHAIRSKRVVTPEGVRAATVHVRNGVIEAIAGYNDLPSGKHIYDAGESVVMPGLVDTHVHINEPGRTDWEGFETATRAAAAGGVTTLIDMPLNSIPATTTAAALETKRTAARKKCWVNVGFWGGVVPGTRASCARCIARARSASSVFWCLQACRNLRTSAKTISAPHCQNLRHWTHRCWFTRSCQARLRKQPGSLRSPIRAKYRTWLLSRPPGAETKAVEMMIRLAREFKARVHIVHLSSELSLPLIRRAKKEGVRITAETCPHYLFFTSGSIGNGRTEYKCAPPIRDLQNCKKLWTALGKNTIDFVVSDHSPSPPAMKCLDTGDFFKAWGGISSLQLGLPVIWTKMSGRNISLKHLVRWMCSGPAQLAGLEKHKGAIAIGYDADIVVWNPEKRFIVRPKMLQHRHKLTPYANDRCVALWKPRFCGAR